MDKFIRNDEYVKHIQYSNFDQIKEIGSGGYGTVYTAKYKKYSEVRNMKETVVLKQMRNFDETPELFISEVSNSCTIYDSIKVTFNLMLLLFLFN